MTETRRLVLHIGTHKTATGTLQAAFERERERLLAQGVYYANTVRPPHPHLPKHCSVYNAFVGGADRVRAESEILMREFEASGCHTLVLSEEGLSGPPILKHKATAWLPLLAPGFDVQVVALLRRQDTFAESLWNQYVRARSASESIADFVQLPDVRQHMRYIEVLNAWAMHAPVTAIGFEAAQETGLFAAFGAATGIDLPADDRRHNASTPPECAAYMAAMNRLNVPWNRREVELALGPVTRKTALGSRLRRQLLDRYAAHNERLARRYGVVFPDAMPDEPAEPVATPTAAEVARLAEAMAALPPDLAKGNKDRWTELGDRPLPEPMAAPSSTRAAMPRLVVHIGTRTTASAYLQQAMWSQRDALAQQGFLYGRTDRLPIGGEAKHHFLHDHLSKDAKPKPGLAADLAQELAASGCHTLVLSEENLAGPANARHIGRLAEFAEHFDIRAVCLLRRQDRFAEEFWAGRSLNGQETRQIVDFVQGPHLQRYMTYLDQLLAWRRYVDVQALGFEEAVSQGLLSRFSQAMGFELSAEPFDPVVQSRFDLAAAMVGLKRLGIDCPWQTIAPALGEGSSRPALGSVLRAALLERYAGHNEVLARRFGVTFTETLPDEPEEALDEPAPEVMARLREAAERRSAVRRATVGPGVQRVLSRVKVRISAWLRPR